MAAPTRGNVDVLRYIVVFHGIQLFISFARRLSHYSETCPNHYNG